MVYRRIVQKVCKRCGSAFETTDKRRMYCSDRCRDDEYNARRLARREAARHRVCPVCGKPFQARNVRGIYCSDVCRIRGFRARKQ